MKNQKLTREGHEDHRAPTVQGRFDVMTSKKETEKNPKKSAKKPKSVAKEAPNVRDTKRPRITVLIADDHSVVREGLVSLITRKADMTVIGEAGNGREAVDLWKQHHPDVTLRSEERRVGKECRGGWSPYICRTKDVKVWKDGWRL